MDLKDFFETFGTVAIFALTVLFSLLKEKKGKKRAKQPVKPPRRQRSAMGSSKPLATAVYQPLSAGRSATTDMPGDYYATVAPVSESTSLSDFGYQPLTETLQDNASLAVDNTVNGEQLSAMIPDRQELARTLILGEILARKF